MVLKGIEVDILADGSLDLPDLPWLGSTWCSPPPITSSTCRARQTRRILRAMDNRHVSILAHRTGRLIGVRDAYLFDMERVIEAAHQSGCCLEINGDPDRLDLIDVHAQAAKSAGVRVAISTDAHSIAGLGHMRFGVDQARPGLVEASDVVDTRPLPELKKLVRP